MVLQPGAFYASVSLGYGTSESACFAPPDWVPEGGRAARQLAHRRSPAQFCHDQLLVSVGTSPPALAYADQHAAEQHVNCRKFLPTLSGCSVWEDPGPRG